MESGQKMMIADLSDSIINVKDYKKNLSQVTSKI